MKKKMIIFSVFLLFTYAVFSNELIKDNDVDKKSYKQRDFFNTSNFKKSQFGFQSFSLYDYNQYNDEAILSRKQTIDLMIAGGISIGGSVLLAGLGGLCIGLYYYFNPLLNYSYTDTSGDYDITYSNSSDLPLAFIVLAGVSFGFSGIFLIMGIIFISVGASAYSKYYKDNDLSFFINSEKEKLKLGFSLKI